MNCQLSTVGNHASIIYQIAQGLDQRSRRSNQRGGNILSPDTKNALNPGRASGAGVLEGEIDVADIWMKFPGRDRSHLVLEAVGLSVSKGAFVSLLGPSGCGKSTLLKVISGLLEPSAGSVTIEGKPPREAMRRGEVGMVFQRPTLLPWRRSTANVSLLCEITGTPEKKRRGEVAEQMLELVGLSDAADKLPAELSGGMAQRVALARALALDPNSLLLDEPFGALDAITRERMNRSLLEIWSRTGKTIVLVTHGISEAVFMSDEIHVMGTEPGRIIERLEIDLPRPRSDETMVGPKFGEYERHLRRLLVTGAGEPGLESAS